MSQASAVAAHEDDRLLAAPAVAEIVAMSLGTIRRRVDERSFPAPVRIGRLVRWRKSDIDAFLRDLPATSTK
jgi:excisionase family DNA binding protein